MSTRVSHDALQVQVQVGDLVRVIHWGHPVRLSDIGGTFTVAGFTPFGALIHGTDLARGRAVPSGMVAVTRRDGAPGHEGNR